MEVSVALMHSVKQNAKTSPATVDARWSRVAADADSVRRERTEQNDRSQTRL